MNLAMVPCLITPASGVVGSGVRGALGVGFFVDLDFLGGLKVNLSNGGCIASRVNSLGQVSPRNGVLC